MINKSSLDVIIQHRMGKKVVNLYKEIEQEDKWVSKSNSYVEVNKNESYISSDFTSDR